MYIALVIAMILTFFVVTVIRYRRKESLHNFNMLAAIITTVEVERKRIAADIHDSIGPMLSNVKFQVDSLHLSEQDKAVAVGIKQHIDAVITNLRSVSYNLIPGILLKKGFVRALQNYIDQEANEQLNIEFECKQEVILPEAQSVHLFRMMEEIIHNTKKHANASLLKILFEQSDNYYLIRTRDNGIGFDVDHVMMNTKHIGLYSLQQRCDMMGAGLTIHSKQHQGVEMNIRIPR